MRRRYPKDPSCLKSPAVERSHEAISCSLSGRCASLGNPERICLSIACDLRGDGSPRPRRFCADLREPAAREQVLLCLGSIVARYAAP